MIKSPSFSRSCESKTIMNSPFSIARAQPVSSDRESKAMEKSHVLTESGNRILDRIELEIGIRRRRHVDVGFLAGAVVSMLSHRMLK